MPTRKQRDELDLARMNFSLPGGIGSSLDDSCFEDESGEKGGAISLNRKEMELNIQYFVKDSTKDLTSQRRFYFHNKVKQMKSNYLSKE